MRRFISKLITVTLLTSLVLLAIYIAPAFQSTAQDPIVQTTGEYRDIPTASTEAQNQQSPPAREPTPVQELKIVTPTPFPTVDAPLLPAVEPVATATPAVLPTVVLPASLPTPAQTDTDKAATSTVPGTATQSELSPTSTPQAEQTVSSAASLPEPTSTPTVVEVEPTSTPTAVEVEPTSTPTAVEVEPTSTPTALPDPAHNADGELKIPISEIVVIAPTSTPTPTTIAADMVPNENSDTITVSTGAMYVDSLEGLFVRSAPGEQQIGVLDHRQQVNATGDVQLSDSRLWMRIDSPLLGWVALDYLTQTPPTTTVAKLPVATEAPTAADWDSLRKCESSNNYSIVDSSGLYHGAYQFSIPTWDSLAGRYWPELVGVLPSQASPADQDKMAFKLYELEGAQPWPVCGRYLI